MCGIVGAISERNVTGILLEGLKKLEYRGYDSAGICVLDKNNKLQRVRAVGKVSALEQVLKTHPLSGFCGIAHTRWATHGAPVEHNAHPLMSHHDVAVVHNGIIENHAALREQLINEGYIFESETDTETAAHLIHFYLSKGGNASAGDFLKALSQVSAELEGAFALGVISAAHPGTIGIIRQGSPLAIGIGLEEQFITSDPMAVIAFAKQFIYLEDGDVGLITQHSITLHDKDQQLVERPIQPPLLSNESAASKGHYRHFMLKEIYEQPRVIADTLENNFLPAKMLLKQAKAVHIVACGTSYHAGLVAKYWCETLAGIPCQVEIASEFRYRQQAAFPATLFITISQSGETADTLAALRYAKTLPHYTHFLAVCNVPSSSLVRESECVLMTRAGMEIGVASTKAFTTQLTALLALMTDDRSLLKKLPALCEHILALDPKIQQIARAFEDKQHALFLGRGTQYPIALEGALKLKEISYIHAEAYPAGELKHGPLALVDKNMPVIILAPNDDLLNKIKSNIEEVKTRGGQCFIFADEHAGFEDETHARLISLPTMDPLIAPIAYTIPLQLLAYHVAILKGTDVDQPRNLAKSVTVE